LHTKIQTDLDQPMNISSQIERIENRLSRIRILQQPPKLQMLTVNIGEERPVDLGPWDLVLQIEPKRQPV